MDQPELPKRPAHAGTLGKVKTFVFDSLTLVTQVRPPSTSFNIITEV